MTLLARAYAHADQHPDSADLIYELVNYTRALIHTTRAVADPGHDWAGDLATGCVAWPDDALDRLLNVLVGE